LIIQARGRKKKEKSMDSEAKAEIGKWKKLLRNGSVYTKSKI
jgi:hypothetical protein